MASVFGHAFVAGAVGYSWVPEHSSKKFWTLAVACSVLPDADVLAFKFGIPYHHVLGHRGITHSLAFAVAWGLLVTALAYREHFPSPAFWKLAGVFSLITVSHGVLDAMTNGGLGVAFFAPFENSRYFLPFSPIQVSPIGVSAFFSEWGLAVLRSEWIWIGLPCVAAVALVFVFRQTKKRWKHSATG